MTLEFIPLENIAEEYPYGLRFDFEDGTLESSLEKQGILFPLLLAPGSGQKAILIAGHKRFFFALRKGWRHVPVLFVEEKFSQKEFFLLSLYSNWNQNFSDLDRMAVLRKSEKVFGLSSKEVMEEIMPLLGIPSSRGVLDDYRKTGELIDEIHSLIAQKRLPFRGASSLVRFSKEEQLFLAQFLFAAVHLTAGHLILVAEWLSDLKKTRWASLEEAFKEESIQTVLEDSHPDPRARGEKFFAAVRSLRFPRTSQEEKDFHRLKRELEREKEIFLQRPQSLETEGLLLQARLKNREGLTRVLNFLEAHRVSLESFLDPSLASRLK